MIKGSMTQAISVYSIDDLCALSSLNKDHDYVIDLMDNLDFNQDSSFKDKNYMNYVRNNGFKTIDLSQVNVIINGNNHTISNLSLGGSNATNVGLFNFGTNPTVVKKLNIKNAVVVGAQNVGILASEFNGVVSNTSVDGIATGQSNVGFFVGKSTKGVVFFDSCASGMVSSMEYSNELVGSNKDAAVIGKVNRKNLEHFVLGQKQLDEENDEEKILALK